jgi:hypothetical protein
MGAVSIIDRTIDANAARTGNLLLAVIRIGRRAGIPGSVFASAPYA